MHKKRDLYRLSFQSFSMLVGLLILTSSAGATTYTAPASPQGSHNKYFLLNQSSVLENPGYSLASGTRYGRAVGAGTGAGGQFYGTGNRIASGIFAIIPGFGLGHVVQGRWAQDGWLYTAGEVGSLGVVALGFGAKNGELLVAGILGFLYFKVTEVVSIFGGPQMPVARWFATHSMPCQSNTSAERRSGWAWCFQQRI
jgi:hypothetical protein